MKIPAILTFLLAAVLSAMPLSKAHADDVSFDVFYNSLADDGDWYNTPEFGYVWQPYVAYKTDKWRPYTDGYWAQTDDGWTWVSYENFGWATYHYGRWTSLEGTGWVWVPGYDWGPGWVSWRTSDDYVGWAPLPPKREQGAYEGRVVDNDRRRPAPSVSIDYSDVEPEDGYNTAVDEQYDIGPDNYCFVETRSFGAPVLREVLLPPQQNIVIIENTVNVTNITYRRDRDRVFVRNGGPDFLFINRHVDRPIQQLRLDRHDDMGFLRDRSRGGGNPTLVRDGVLQVAAPSIARRPVNFTQIKPTRIKQELAQPRVAHGWGNTGADQQTVQRVREQFKQQARNPGYRSPGAATPPPIGPRRADREAGNVPPAPDAAPGANVPPAAGNNGAHHPLTDAEKQARRDAAQHERESRSGQTNPGAANPPPGAPNGPVPPTKGMTDADKAARRAQRQQQQQAVAPTATPANPAGSTDADKAARRAQRQQERQQAAAPGANPTGPSDADKAARRAQRQQEQQQAAAPGANPAGPSDADKAARRAQRQQQQAAGPQQAGPTDAEREARRAQRQQQQQAQPQAQPQPQRQQPQAGPSDAEREARRAQRQQQQQAAGPQQTGPSDAERESRRAQRQQQQQQAQPQAQPQPQRQQQPQAQPQRQQAPAQAQPQPQQQQAQGKGDDDKKKKKDGQ